MSEVSKKEAIYLAKKIYKAVKLVNDTVCLLQEVTNSININNLDEEDLRMIALTYNKVSKNNPFEYLDSSMHDSFYSDMDDLMDKIDEIIENTR